MHSSRMRTVRCSSHLGGGLSAWQGGVHTSPRGQTDTCENITFLQLLLRTVTRNNSSRMRTIRLLTIRVICFSSHQMSAPGVCKGTSLNRYPVLATSSRGSMYKGSWCQVGFCMGGQLGSCCTVEVQCIMGIGHMGLFPPPDRMIDRHD